MGLNNYNFHLYACGFGERVYEAPISMLIAAIDVPSRYQHESVCTLAAKEVGFNDKSEYARSYPGRTEDIADMWVRIFDERGANTYVKRMLITNFDGNNLQLVSVPKMSGVTLCTHFKNISYDNLWYCSDWGG